MSSYLGSRYPLSAQEKAASHLAYLWRMSRYRRITPKPIALMPSAERRHSRSVTLHCRRWLELGKLPDLWLTVPFVRVVEALGLVPEAA